MYCPLNIFQVIRSGELRREGNVAGIWGRGCVQGFDGEA